MSLAAVFLPFAQDPLLDAPWRAYATGEFPHYSAVAMAAGDLDGDLDLDLLVAHDFYGGPGVVVLFNGGGSFGPPARYDTPYNEVVGDVALADVDSDGDLDALATVPGTYGDLNRVSVWRNRGDGSFEPRRNFSAGPGPLGLAVADFNGDGFPDLATANGDRLGTGATVSTLRHNGASGALAGFLAPVIYAAAPAVAQVEAADLDGDGDFDLAAGGGSTAGHAILRNDGSGVFAAPVLYPPAPGSSYATPALALADLDRDGAPDLIGASATNDYINDGLISVRRNDGAGSFGQPILYTLGDWTWLPKHLRAADLDGDGWLDLAATTPTGRSLDGWHLLANDGAGGLLPSVFHESAKSTWDALAADVDGDGDLDLLTCAYDSSVVAVHENHGQGGFPILERTLVGVLSSDLDHGDIDGDGDLDLVTCDDSVRIVRGLGDGHFQPALRFATPIRPGSVKLRDMDADGDLDLLIGPNPNSPPYHFAVALNTGNGTYEPAVVTPVYASQAGDVEGVDFDHDGRREVVFADPGQASANYVFRNLGDGISYQRVIELDHGATQLAGADLDHDGHQDLIANTVFGLTVWPGNGDLSFQPFHYESFTAHPFALADFDLDGHLDVGMIMDQPSFGTVTLGTALGYGDGDFAFPSSFAGTSGREGAFRIASEVHAADLTGDGLVDLLLVSNAPCDLSVYAGRGDGTFGAPQRYGIGYQTMFAAPVDFDSDGALDLAATISLPPGGFQDAVVLLASTGSGFLLRHSELHRGSNARFTVTGALPGETVIYLRSLAGTGAGPCVGQLGGLCLDLQPPLILLGSDSADANGQALLTAAVPSGAPLIEIHVQAVARRGSGGAASVKTNTASAAILP